jgi:hypothetical protein
MVKKHTHPLVHGEFTYQVTCFKKETGPNEEDFVWARDVEVTPEQVIEWYKLEPDDPPIACYKISPRVGLLMRGDFDFERYEYYVEAVAAES